MIWSTSPSTHRSISRRASRSRTPSGGSTNWQDGRYGGGFLRFETALTTALEMASHAYQRDGKLSGLATGLRDLDGKMGGLQKSDLIILAGRPGMGKTSLATNIAYNVARAWRHEVQADGQIATVNGGRVGFFSLEMSAEQLAPVFCRSRPRFPRARSGAARSRKPISR